MSKTANNSNEVQNVWLRIYQICGVVAAFDSVFVLSQPLIILLLSAIGHYYVAILLTLGLMAAYLYIIDYAMFKFLPPTLKALFAKEASKMTDEQKKSNMKKLLYGMLIFCLGTSAVTGGITLYLRHPAAEIITDKPQTVDEIALNAKSQNDLKSNSQSFDSDIKTLQSERDNAVYRAGTQNKELVKLAETGRNGWATGKINAARKAVRESFDAKIQKLRDKKGTTLSTATNTAALLTESVAKDNQFKRDLFTRQTGAMANMLMLFGVGATFVQWFAAIMLAFLAAVYGIGDDGLTLLGTVVNTATGAVNTGGMAVNPVYTDPTMNKNYKPLASAETNKKRSDGGNTMYIQGYIKVLDTGYWYEPVQFINRLRNTFKRESPTRDARLKSLRMDLFMYLDNEKNPSQKILDFIMSYPEIVGEENFNMLSKANFSKFDSDTQSTALHESAHFIAFAALNYTYNSTNTAKELFCDANAKINKSGNGRGHMAYNHPYERLVFATDEQNELYLQFEIVVKMAGLAIEFVTHYNTDAESFIKAQIEQGYNLEGQDVWNAFQSIEEAGANGIETKTIEEYFFDAVELVHEHLAKIYEVAANVAQNKTLNAERLKYYENKFFPRYENNF
jgi:hypothetical protein